MTPYGVILLHYRGLWISSKAIGVVKTASLKQTGNTKNKTLQQLTNIVRHAEALGLDLVDVFDMSGQVYKAHIGGTGRTVDNFTKICNQYDDIRFLLVDTPDSLIKSTGILEKTTLTLKDRGIEIIYCNPAYKDSGTPENRFALAMILEFAKFDSELRIERTRDGMRRAVQRGIYPHTPPLGYKKGRETGIHEPNSNFKTIRYLFKKYAKGKITLAKLEDLLFRQGVRNRNDNPVNSDSLRKALTNPFYKGVVFTEDSYGRGFHETMLTDDEFEAIQKLLDEEDAET